MKNVQSLPISDIEAEDKMPLNSKPTKEEGMRILNKLN